LDSYIEEYEFMSVEDNKFNEELDKAIDYAHKVTAEKGETSPKPPPPGTPLKKCGRKFPTSIKSPKKPV
jgi:hypothetical protein